MLPGAPLPFAQIKPSIEADDIERDDGKNLMSFCSETQETLPSFSKIMFLRE